MPSLTSLYHPARRADTRPALVFLVLAAFLAAVYSVPGLDQFARDLVYSLLGAASGIAVLAGVRLHRPAHPGAWSLLAVGILLFAAGDGIWMILDVLGVTPFPSIADVAYLLGYPTIMLAFLRVIAVRVRGGDRSGLLDATILALAVALVGWVVMVRPVLQGEGDSIALAIGAAYPLGDLVIIGVAIGMLTTPGPRGSAFGLLVCGLLLQFGADVLYAFQIAAGTATDGGLLDLVWLASYTTIGVAALLPTMRVVAVPHPVRIAWLSGTRLTFMAFAMFAGPVMVLLHDPGDRMDVALLALGSGLLSGLVLIRLALVVRALAHDIATRRSLEEELSFRASHDSLTGLANRRAFMGHLDTALAGGRGGPVSVLFMDLDDFKGINDTLGHAAGDALLVVVAGRIRGHLRGNDHASRMGGDEFGILLHVDEAGAVSIAERLLESLREPFQVADAAVVTRGSIGIAIVRPGAETAQVLADADIAMYRAKAMGKSQVCVFADEMRVDVVDRMRLEADLRSAIEQGAFSLAYQPIVDLATGRATAVEALLRWVHPERGTMPPASVVLLAEQTGLIRPLGDWILRTACLQVAAWRRSLEPALGLSVNLSPRQVADHTLVRTVQSTVAAAGLPIGALILEVTEGALLADAQQTVANLRDLRALGAWVAIDDFGTGHSSLGALGRLPVDILKIAPEFVEHLDREDDRRLAGIVVNLGETLGLRVVAEGIERQEQLDAIRGLGCGLGQGYLLAAPMTAAAFEALFAAPRAVGIDGARGGLAFGSQLGA